MDKTRAATLAKHLVCRAGSSSFVCPGKHDGGRFGGRCTHSPWLKETKFAPYELFEPPESEDEEEEVDAGVEVLVLLLDEVEGEGDESGDLDSLDLPSSDFFESPPALGGLEEPDLA